MDKNAFESLADLSPIDKAVELRRRHICNCCQSVVAALAFDPRVLSAASGFGGGMGTGAGPCGALIGALMAAGLKTDGTKRFNRQITEKFRESSGSLICRELKGLDTGKVLCSCDDCVRNAVRAFQKVLPE